MFENAEDFKKTCDIFESPSEYCKNDTLHMG